MVTPFLEKYKNEVTPKMMEKFGYKNKMAVPKVEKVVVNTGFGRQAVAKTGEDQKKFIDSIVEDLTTICGQKAVKTQAKQSIASFKTRKGMILGAKVTLRGKKMVDFLERLIHLVLPRTRDFQGILPRAVDNQGNLTVAIIEHIVFPEILPEKARNIFGLEVTVVSSAGSREEGLELFRLLGFPIKTGDEG